MALKLPKELRIIDRAPLWKRAFAYVFDSIILSIIVELPFATTIKKSFAVPDGGFLSAYNYIINNSQQIQVVFFTSTIIAILTLVYWSVFEYRLKQTLGKMLFRLHVKSEKGELNYQQTLIRNISKLWFPLLIIDCIALINSKKQQRFSERWSKTYVVDRSMVIK